MALQSEPAFNCRPPHHFIGAPKRTVAGNGFLDQLRRFLGVQKAQYDFTSFPQRLY
jgi:hypothetical protein